MQKIKSFLTPKRKKWLVITTSALLVLLLGGVVYGLSIRQSLLDQAIAKAKAKLKEDYALNLEMKRYGFAGLTAVQFEEVTINPDSGRKLLEVKKLQVAVNILPLLRKKISIDRVDLDHAALTFVKEDSSSNYDFLFRRERKDSADTVTTKRNLAQTVERLIKQAFDQIPYTMDLKEVEISYQDSSGAQRIRVPEGKIRRGKYDIAVFLNEHDAKWNLTGRIDRKDQEFSVTVSAETPDIELPLLRKKYGLTVRFDQVTLDLKEIRRHGVDQLKLVGACEVKDLSINHRRLSDREVKLPDGKASGGILISENALETLEDAEVQIKEFIVKPQIKYVHSPSKLLNLGIHTGKFKAQDLFDAIPDGLFETLEGVQVEGEIAYDMDFSVDFDHPDDLVFVSRIDDKNLKVKKWGNANIPQLNKEFVHDIYEDTLKTRSIIVGPSNPNFTPLQQIAPILKRTVLNTEDPFFYDHNGFEEEAFQLSIITNIKEKAFKRGASTISMQLVKNLYLNRNKTMMRKFEEILLVWLTERSKEVSKDRLLEIYFNIIEWGKNIYGINEASNYYFGKSPAELTLGESLYLSSIVPRPKTGLSSFDYTGHLKPWVQRHFNTYGYILNKRDQLNDIDVPEGYGFYQVVLQPNLRPPRPKGIVDSIPTMDEMHDMIDEIDQEEQQRKTLLERLFGKPKEVEE